MRSTAPRQDLANLDRHAMEEVFAAAGIPRFRARQVFRWVYGKGVTDFAAMTDLGAGLRAELDRGFRTSTPELVREDRSVDGTRKFLLGLEDGRRIEAVYIPDTPRQTFCVSSQVGCAMNCDFCLTGKMGFGRNLTPGEIAGQVRVLAHATGLASSSFNIVLMGMGEPLHNYDNVMAAMRILADEHGFGVTPRRVTLSTVGVVPGMERLAAEPWMPNLAVSLHATTDEQRNALVPINRKYPIAQLMEACRRFPLKRRSRITFEYVLLDGVNDTPEDARRLVRLVGDMKAKVNLLPLNPAPGIPYERPSDERVNRFAGVLARHGVTVSVRKSRGRDIRAACGQLIVEGQQRSTGQKLAALLH
ncbi:MAG TPA: 23S rRNA (adenine(2503)-C(2))-methyltransferase RlmN [Vicinamibacterales bacterium]